MLQNYNKILTKRTVFSIILNKTQIKTSTKKIRIFYAPRFFSGQNRKKVRKLREQIRYIYIYIYTRVCVFYVLLLISCT